MSVGTPLKFGDTGHRRVFAVPTTECGIPRRTDRWFSRFLLKLATTILKRIETDASAAAELLPLVYDELRRLAWRYMGDERGNHTLDPTALVHEAWFKLVGDEGHNTQFEGRGHFLGVAARAMRQVLVDHARQRGAQKRGGDWLRITLDPEAAGAGFSGAELLEIHDALERLAATDVRLARVVELCYFGGLTIRETAAVLKIANSTVIDDWALARAWLLREFGSPPEGRADAESPA
jgi:RNA polymerase sigma factor (TIGR02999 family)